LNDATLGGVIESNLHMIKNKESKRV
jgi:hypothetical protein